MSDVYKLQHEVFTRTGKVLVNAWLIDGTAVTSNEYTLISNGKGIEFQIIDNDEDPYTVIRSTQCVIQFNSTADLNMATFASGPDSRWLLICFIGTVNIGEEIFIGQVVMNEIGEDFMPAPNVVILKATDGLGLLKNIPLTDFANRNPYGHFKIIDFIAWCLSKCIPPVSINVAFNIKIFGLNSDISTPNTDREHMFDTCYLWAKMFEDQIGTCINCYDALKRILGEEAVLFQRNGQWWIVRIDEVGTVTTGDHDELGGEEIINGEFTGNADNWLFADGNWSYNSNNVIHTPGSSGFMLQVGSLEEGATYEVTVVIGGTTGTLGIFLDAGANVPGFPGTTNTFQGVWNASGDPSKIIIIPSSDFDGTIDSISMKKVTHISGGTTSTGFYVTQFDGNGKFIGNLGDKQYTKEIGKDSPYTIFFSKEQTRVIMDRPCRDVKETFDYQLPLEIPDNKDFSRGDIIDDSDFFLKTYQIEAWQFYKQIPPTAPLNNTAFIRRVFDALGNELERYAVIGIGDNDYYYLESAPIQVGYSDRFNFSVDIRYNNSDVFGSGFNRVNVAQIRFYANDGTRWTLDGGTSVQLVPTWVESSSDFSTDNVYFVIEFDGATSDTEWRTATFWNNAPCPSLPEGLYGYITIVLVANTSTDTYETQFSNLQFEYIPYINGSYSKYTGQYNQVTRDTDQEKYKAKRENQVFMSDSPRPLFKGAIFRLLDIGIDDEEGILFTDNTDFAASGSTITLPGDRTNVLYKTQELQIKFTASNDGIIHIISVTYDSGSDTTLVVVVELLTDESDVSASFYIPRFALTSQAISEIIGFYDASLFPDGTDAVNRSYGELQIYDVWDQFRSEMRIFQAQCQGLDLDTLDMDSLVNGAHILHRWFFRDSTPHTDNKVFYLLTFDQLYRISEWTGTFRELSDSTRSKQFTGNVFKYISK